MDKSNEPLTPYTYRSFMVSQYEVYPILQLLHLPLFWKGFLQDFGVCLWEFSPIQPEENWLGQTVVLDERSCS